MSDLDFTYPKILSLRKRADRAMVKYGMRLPDEVFAFATRYGEQFFYFEIGTGDDPVVFRWYDEQLDKFTKITDSLSGFFEAQLNEQESAFKE